MSNAKPKADESIPGPENTPLAAHGDAASVPGPAAVPPVAADPAEGQLDAANDEQLNEEPAPVVAAGPDAGEPRQVSNKQGGARADDISDKVRTSANSVWCPKDGVASPRGTAVCPACGFNFESGKAGRAK